MKLPSDRATWPQRPASVPADAWFLTGSAMWGVGNWRDELMQGDWTFWRATGELLEESEFEDGERCGTMRRYQRDGSLASVTEYGPLGNRKVVNYRPPWPPRPDDVNDVDFTLEPDAVHRVTFWTSIVEFVCERQEYHGIDGQPLDADGRPLPANPGRDDEIGPEDTDWMEPPGRYDGLMLSGETVTQPDGTVLRTRYGRHGHGERVTRDGELVAEHWYDRDGHRTATVTRKGGKGAREVWRAYDPSGTPIAKGVVRGGTQGPRGKWKLLHPDGATRTTVRFAPLRPSRSADLGRLAVAMPAWQAASIPPALADAEAVRWRRLETVTGSARHVPFLLKGLVVPDPFVAGYALSELASLVLHVGVFGAGVREVTGPVVRFLVALLPEITTDALRIGPLRLLVDIATERAGRSVGRPDVDLRPVTEIKRLFRALGPDRFAGNERFDDAYGAVYHAINEAVPYWITLSSVADPQVRRYALILLAVSEGEPAAAALRAGAQTDPDPTVRAEALLGLALHDPTPETTELLGRVLAGPDPLARWCAALTRCRLDPHGAQVDPLVDGLAGDGLDGYGRLYLASGSTVLDAARALTLLPPARAGSYVDPIGAAIDRVGPPTAVSIVDSLLSVAFGDGPYEAGEALTGYQRSAVLAIAGSRQPWRLGDDLSKALGFTGLPGRRDELRALAGA